MFLKMFLINNILAWIFFNPYLGYIGPFFINIFIHVQNIKQMHPVFLTQEKQSRPITKKEEKLTLLS